MGHRPAQKQAVSVVFLDADGGQPVETLRLPGAYCIRYQEQFSSSEVSGGAYRCYHEPFNDGTEL